MPSTTTKGLPFPVGTDRVMDGDDAIAALAQALDFTSSKVLPTTTLDSAQLGSYPDGWSVLALSSAQGSAGGWPDGVGAQIVTLKQNNNQATQWWFRTTFTAADMRIRHMTASGNSPWLHIGQAVATGMATVSVNASATGSVVVTLPTGRFTAAPDIVATLDNGTIFIIGVSAISASSFTITLRYYAPPGTTTTTQQVHWFAR